MRSKRSQLNSHFIWEHCVPQRKGLHHLTGTPPMQGRNTSRNVFVHTENANYLLPRALKVSITVLIEGKKEEQAVHPSSRCTSTYRFGPDTLGSIPSDTVVIC